MAHVMLAAAIVLVVAILAAAGAEAAVAVVTLLALFTGVFLGIIGVGPLRR